MAVAHVEDWAPASWRSKRAAQVCFLSLFLSRKMLFALAHLIDCWISRWGSSGQVWYQHENLEITPHSLTHLHRVMGKIKTLPLSSRHLRCMHANLVTIHWCWPDLRCSTAWLLSFFIIDWTTSASVNPHTKKWGVPFTCWLCGDLQSLYPGSLHCDSSTSLIRAEDNSHHRKTLLQKWDSYCPFL